MVHVGSVKRGLGETRSLGRREVRRGIVDSNGMQTARTSGRRAYLRMPRSRPGCLPNSASAGMGRSFRRGPLLVDPPERVGAVASDEITGINIDALAGRPGKASKALEWHNA